MLWLCWIRHAWSSWGMPHEEERPRRVMGDWVFTTRLIQSKECHRCGQINQRVVRKLGERPFVRGLFTDKPAPPPKPPSKHA